MRRSDPAALWDRLDLGVRRMVLREIAVVTVLPGPRGRRPGGGYFDPTSVLVEPNRAGEVNRLLADAGIYAYGLELGTDLEDLFLELTGGETSAEGGFGAIGGPRGAT